jgi:16S rRNA (cytosine967-C5)-methyltransferase
MSPARLAAFRVLTRVDRGGFASDLLMQDTAKLDPRDAALAHQIVFGVLRYQLQLDWLISELSNTKRLDREIVIALRMGIYQIRHLDRVPPHAAVAESVELVKQARKRSAAGFVNALLRKVSRDPVRWPDRPTELSIPAWMLARWESRYGVEVAEKIARAALLEPAKYNLGGRQQDIGAQSIVPLLEIKPGNTVLDLCAAPGHKTLQALAAGGRVVACDFSVRRLSEVEQAPRVALDATQPLPFRARFDRVLLDAPCSGTGTLARNPEIKWRLTEADLARHQTRQRAMLENARQYVNGKGVLVYATCSLEPEENEGVVRDLPNVEKHLRIPGIDVGDGFFAAVIRSS